MITAAEQFLIELINRARLDPQAEADRHLGGDLDQNNSGAPFGTHSRQPLAVNEALNSAAASHSLHMLAVDMFAHEDIGDGTATQRMADAGYPFTGSWGTGENISVRGTTGTIDLDAAIASHHEGLFKSIGHRSNILAGDFRELGVGQERGDFSGFGDGQTYDASMLTENFAYSGDRYFLTGVVYDDLDGDGFYSIGEGRSGSQVSASGVGTGTSAAAGGYDIAVTPSSGFVTVTGGSSASAVVQVEIGTRNVKLDFIGTNEIAVSTNAVLVSGILQAHLLGTDALELTGSATGEMLFGNSGNNILSGNGGNDTLAGGAGADRLNGGNGNDVLYGGGGSDFVAGGNGSDRIYGDADGANDTYGGGAGVDTLDYSGVGTALNIVLANNLATGSLIGTDQVFGFERVLGGSGSDVIRGNLASFYIDGRGGNDQITAGANASTLLGGAGNDMLRGFNGNDRLFGGNDNDTLSGGNGADLLAGENGNDRFVGDADGANDIYGGGAGIDTIDFSAITAGLNIVLYNNVATSAQSGSDQIFGIERVLGGSGNDVIRGDINTVFLNGNGGSDSVIGGVGANNLFGGLGNDNLRGFGGDDRLNGGFGFDRLEGGTGNDTFIFANGFGRDIIVDFDAFTAAEKIDLSAVTAITSFADLQANHLSQVGADAVITDGANTITLDGVLIGNLDAGDFIF